MYQKDRFYPNLQSTTKMNVLVNQFIKQAHKDGVDLDLLVDTWVEVDKKIANAQRRDRAKTHIVKINDADFDLYDLSTRCDNDYRFDCTLLDKYATFDWYNGDIIKIEQFCGDRNDATYLWNGDHAVELYRDEDDYGSVPSEFLVGAGRFHAKYWYSKKMDEGIDHNGLVFAKFDSNTCKMLNDEYNSLNDNEYKFVKFNYDRHEWEMFLYKTMQYPTKVPFVENNTGLFMNDRDEMVYNIYDKFDDIDFKRKTSNYFLCNSIWPEWAKNKHYSVYSYLGRTSMSEKKKNAVVKLLDTTFPTVKYIVKGEDDENDRYNVIIYNGEDFDESIIDTIIQAVQYLEK